MNRREVMATGLGLLAAPALVSGVRAEVDEITIARGFAIPHLPLMIMEHEKLIEKHASVLGRPGVTVAWSSIGGGAVMNDALLAGSLTFGVAGPPPIITLWAKTRGTPLEVRGLCNESILPLYLNTRNPKVKSIADFTQADKIAVGAVKVSIQAILLQMAAAKMFGDKDYARLDPLTVGMNSVDATTALRASQSEVTTNFSLAPFQYEELKLPNVHRVLNSYDVMGGPHTYAMIYTTKAIHDRNPLTMKAFLAAMQEANEIIATRKDDAVSMYVDVTKSKSAREDLLAILNDPEIAYTLTPKETMRFADFMYKVGSIKVKPTNWKDLFFEDVHQLQGS
ncbi:MAG: ABC transporter substrate-binding protein [Beijerinckiaceae bacterium]